MKDKNILAEAIRRRKEFNNNRFARQELGELLKLFSSLGITVTVGIVAFFWGGLWLDRKLVSLGWETHKLPLLLSIPLGIGITIYWAYLRISKHLEEFEPKLGAESLDDTGKENDETPRPEK